VEENRSTGRSLAELKEALQELEALVEAQRPVLYPTGYGHDQVDIAVAARDEEHLRKARGATMLAAQHVMNTLNGQMLTHHLVHTINALICAWSIPYVRLAIRDLERVSGHAGGGRYGDADLARAWEAVRAGRAAALAAIAIAEAGLSS